MVGVVFLEFLRSVYMPSRIFHPKDRGWGIHLLSQVPTIDRGLQGRKAEKATYIHLKWDTSPEFITVRAGFRSGPRA